MARSVKADSWESSLMSTAPQEAAGADKTGTWTWIGLPAAGGRDQIGPAGAAHPIKADRSVH